jgi:hypothetical protein
MTLATSASHDVIASGQEVADLIPQIQAADRVALDTEADSLHSYREKLIDNLHATKTNAELLLSGLR